MIVLSNSALLATNDFEFFRPNFKPFASSIPSLRPAPPSTDTDSVDSVEAAIQAAMNKPKDQGMNIVVLLDVVVILWS